MAKKKTTSRASLRLLGRGNNGVAYLRGDGAVVKVTSDPNEVAVAAAVFAMQREGIDTSAFPRIHDIRFGQRVAAIVRENVIPFRGSDFGQRTQALMARDARWHLGGVTGSGRVRTALLSQRQLRPLGRSAAFIRHRWNVSPGDIRPGNLGHRKGSEDFVLFDVGRSPLETTIAKTRGNECPALQLRKTQITALIGKAPSVKSCQMVNGQQLRRVMGGYGWSSQEVAETAGFHDPSRRIWLRHGNADSLTHELWHAVGIIDKDLAVWLCEGLTEATAQDDDKLHGIKHRSTYPEWVRLVRTRFAPLAGMTVLKLAAFVVSSPRNAGVRLAQHLQQRTGVPQARWYQVIGPGSNDPRDFLALQTRVARK